MAAARVHADAKSSVSEECDSDNPPTHRVSGNKDSKKPRQSLEPKWLEPYMAFYFLFN
jgi:hypothetical protein